MFRLARLLSALILISMPMNSAHDDDQLEDVPLFGPEDPDLGEGEILFVFDTEKGQKEIKINYHKITQEWSPVLYSIIEEQMERRNYRIHLENCALESFEVIVHFLNNKTLPKTKRYRLDSLVEHIQRFKIAPLSKTIAFDMPRLLRELDVGVEVLIRMIPMVACSEVDWHTIVYKAIIEYVLMRNMENDRRQFMQKLLSHFSYNSTLIESLTKPDPNDLQRIMREVLAKKAAQKEADEYAAVDDLINDVINKGIEKCAQQNIRPRIRIVIDSELAPSYSSKLQERLENYTVEILPPAVKPYALPSEGGGKWVCHTENCGAFTANIFSCLFQWAGPQYLQMATAGWFCCGGTDLNKDCSGKMFCDNRTGEAIFYLLYYLGKCIADSCMGQTETIQITAKENCEV